MFQEWEWDMKELQTHEVHTASLMPAFYQVAVAVAAVEVNFSLPFGAQ